VHFLFGCLERFRRVHFPPLSSSLDLPPACLDVWRLGMAQRYPISRNDRPAAVVRTARGRAGTFRFGPSNPEALVTSLYDRTSPRDSPLPGFQRRNTFLTVRLRQ
jgi:hypothetical protein